MTDEFSELDAHQAARRLLGCEIIRTIDGEQLSGRIVETESYDEADAAAHSYGGPRGRNLIMFGPAGYAYVYFTYGMHYCINIVTGPEGRGEAVLIRALEPLDGLSVMAVNRKLTSENFGDLCNGPAKLTQSLGITTELNGHNLANPPLQLILRPALPEKEITATTRIGISKNTEYKQRFYITDSIFVSKP